MCHVFDLFFSFPIEYSNLMDDVCVCVILNLLTTNIFIHRSSFFSGCLFALCVCLDTLKCNMFEIVPMSGTEERMTERERKKREKERPQQKLSKG